MPEKRSGGIGAAVDFSPASVAAARYAADLAPASKSPLHVLHVLEVLPPIIPGTETFFAGDLDRAIAKDRRREKAQLAALEAAEELGFAVILMGTRRRSELEKAVLGSVATEVVRRAPCPVLTVREK